MRYLITIVFLSLLVSRCSPNLTQLKSYKTAEALKEKTLLVIVPNNNDALIFEEYGQTKKAERLIRDNETKRTLITNAFQTEYSFSEVQFITGEEIKYYTNNPAFVISRWEKRDLNDDRQETIYFGISINGEQPIQEGFNTTNIFNQDYQRLVKLLESRLEKLYKKGIQLKAAQ